MNNSLYFVERIYMFARVPVILTLLCAVLVLQSCGYIYSSQIQGFIVDDEDKAGINSATVYIFNKEPPASIDKASAADVLVARPGFITRTGSVTSNNQAGYFSSKVLWDNSFGSFGPEGDSGTIWVWIVHDDYFPLRVKLPGILSGTTNSLQDIKIIRSTLQVGQIRGRVLDSSGNGVNGVRLVIDKSPANETEDADYVTNTRTIEGSAGSFEFNTIRWTAEGTSNVTTMTLRVDDANWAGGGTATNGLRLDLTDGQNVSLDPINISRKPRSEFDAALSGRLIKRLITSNGTTQDYGLSSIEIEVVIDADGDGSLVSGTTKSFYGMTGDDGRFSINLNWTDTNPNDDGPSTELANKPQGEDLLAYKVIFKYNPSPLQGADTWTFGNYFVDVSAQGLSVLSTESAAPALPFLKTWIATSITGILEDR